MSRQNETITCIHRDKIVRPFSFVPFTNLHVLYIYTHTHTHIYIYICIKQIYIYMCKTNYCFNHSHGYHGCILEQRWLGAVHKQVCVTINVKLTFGGVGMWCYDLIKPPYTGTVCLLELLNLFVGKAQHYNHDCSWDLPGSAVDRSLCWVCVLNTFIVSCSLFCSASCGVLTSCH